MHREANHRCHQRHYQQLESHSMHSLKNGAIFQVEHFQSAIFQVEPFEMPAVIFLTSWTIIF